MTEAVARKKRSDAGKPRGPRGPYKKTLEKSGFNNQIIHIEKSIVEETNNIHETDEQISNRISERFEILEYMIDEVIDGNVKSVIVSGPAGLGKSFTVTNKLEAYDTTGDNYKFIKGYSTPSALYQTLYENSNRGNIIVFDDCDNIFFDENSLNLLKAVCDSSDKRIVSWNVKGDSDIPSMFEFKGTIVFITNLDFDAFIAKGHRLAPHLQALISRSHYIDLAMRSKRDYLIRIRQVVKSGMLVERGLNFQQQIEVINYVENNMNSLRELSLRMVGKISDLCKSGKPNWKEIARITCCRN